MHSDPHPHISIVTPVYGCSICLEKLYDRLVTTLTQITDIFYPNGAESVFKIGFLCLSRDLGWSMDFFGLYVKKLLSNFLDII